MQTSVIVGTLTATAALLSVSCGSETRALPSASGAPGALAAASDGVGWTPVKDQGKNSVEPGAIVAVMTAHAPVEYKLICSAKEWLGAAYQPPSFQQGPSGSSDQGLNAAIQVSITSAISGGVANTATVNATLASSQIASASLATVHSSDASPATAACRAELKPENMVGYKRLSVVTDVLVGNRKTITNIATSGGATGTFPPVSAGGYVDAGASGSDTEADMLLAIKWTELPASVMHQP